MMDSPVKILVLGVSGMLGSAIFRVLSENSNWAVFGTNRSFENLRFFSSLEKKCILSNIDVLNSDDLIKVFYQIKPDIVINCIGIIKQHGLAKDTLSVLPINSLLPHRLSNICKLNGTRLILISTDCVFAGRKGMYNESDIPDAEDLYGKSKEIGEVVSERHVLTLRTSIIGHELNSNYSLVNWFLSQSGTVNGFTKAIFSGLPASEIAEVIKTKIIPNLQLHGLYHLSAEPISKFELLNLIKKTYNKTIEIVANDVVVVDRSLDSSRFRNVTSFLPASWDILVQRMRAYNEKYLDLDRV